MLVKTNEYIVACQDSTKDGKTVVNIPSIQGLSYYLGVHRDTIYAWAKEYGDFNEALDRLEAKQGNILINKGLSGEYNSTITRLMLSANHNMREKSDLTTNDKDLPIPILGHVPNNNSDTEDTESE